MANKEDCGDFGCYGVFVNEDAMNQFMFAWIQAHSVIPLNIGVGRSIEMFMKFYGLTEEQINVDSAKSKYQTFNKRLMERMKNG